MALFASERLFDGSRWRLQDMMQNYAFWLVDVSLSRRPPFFVMGSPLSGFSQISSPEMQFATGQINELGADFPVNYYTQMTVSPITLSRGVSATNSTFYTWMKRAREGSDQVQRNLLLMHFMGMTFDGAANALAQVSQESKRVSNQPPQQRMQAGPSPRILPGSDIEIYRIFGKGWMLYNCIPTRYAAGSGLDATSSEVSVEELEVQPERWTEVSLDPRLLLESSIEFTSTTSGGYNVSFG